MEPETPTNQTESAPPTRYQLSAAERQSINNLGNAAVARKLEIYSLNMQLEVAQRERDAADARFSGALALLAESHGMPNAQLSPDFTTLTKGPQ